MFVLLPEVEILDLAGPLQALGEANRSHARYRLRCCSTSDRVRTSQGVVLADLEPLPEVEDRQSCLSASTGRIAGPPLVIVPGMPYAATRKIDRRGEDA